MCRYLGYSRAAYYKSLRQAERTFAAKEVILEMVRAERKIQPRMGGKKLYYMLKEDIHKIDTHFGRDKFFDVLRKAELLVERRRSYQKTTDSHHYFHKYKNLIKGKEAMNPNEVWAADITYLRTERSFVYLSLLTDMYSRKVVGWYLSESLSIEGSMEALRKALKENNIKGNLIHHSDRGIQYCSREYIRMLERHGVSPSMTEENHCYENALAERVNGILKDEYLLDRTFKDLAEAERACREAIELYNTRRPHLALKYRTPQQVHDAA